MAGTEADLMREIGRLAKDLRHRTTQWQYFFEVNTPEGMRLMLEHDEEMRRQGRATGLPDPTLPPPTTVEAVGIAEEAVGFRFPPFLTRIWTEIANGGFGPGYGIFGIDGGLAEECSGQTTASLYLATVQDGGWAEVLGKPWPQKLVLICEWGGDERSAIDCSTPEGKLFDLVEGERWKLKRKSMTFSQWMEAWVKGVELWPYSNPIATL